MTTTSTVSTTEITYNLDIQGMVTDEAKIVTRVYWLLTGEIRRAGTDDIVRDGISGWQNLQVSDTVIPYEQLTEEEVRNWVIASMGPDYEKYRSVVEIYVQRQLRDSQDVDYREFPWQS
jgi:hypothetical protein